MNEVFEIIEKSIQAGSESPEEPSFLVYFCDACNTRGLANSFYTFFKVFEEISNAVSVFLTGIYSPEDSDSSETPNKYDTLLNSFSQFIEPITIDETSKTIDILILLENSVGTISDLSEGSLHLALLKELMNRKVFPPKTLALVVSIFSQESFPNRLGVSLDFLDYFFSVLNSYKGGRIPVFLVKKLIEIILFQGAPYLRKFATEALLSMIQNETIPLEINMDVLKTYLWLSEKCNEILSVEEADLGETAEVLEIISNLVRQNSLLPVTTVRLVNKIVSEEENEDMIIGKAKDSRANNNDNLHRQSEYIQEKINSEQLFLLRRLPTTRIDEYLQTLKKEVGLYKQVPGRLLVPSIFLLFTEELPGAQKNFLKDTILCSDVDLVGYRELMQVFVFDSSTSLLMVPESEREPLLGLVYFLIISFRVRIERVRNYLLSKERVKGLFDAEELKQINNNGVIKEIASLSFRLNRELVFPFLLSISDASLLEQLCDHKQLEKKLGEIIEKKFVFKTDKENEKILEEKKLFEEQKAEYLSAFIKKAETIPSPLLMKICYFFSTYDIILQEV